MTTRICMVRHGETDWNLERRIQGQTDIPLNATGRAQALAMAYNAGHHHFSAIYSSDLSRAMETARAIAEREGLPLRPLPQLRERHFGIFQGITAAQGAALNPAAYAHYSGRDPHYDFESGESLLTFADRVAAGIDWMIRHHTGETVCAVCHAGVLDILYRKATGRPLQSPRDVLIPNCALNWFRFDAQGWHVEAWADRHHLTQVLVETPE
jgi:probable phosphoglycerate mutase